MELKLELVGRVTTILKIPLYSETCFITALGPLPYIGG